MKKKIFVWFIIILLVVIVCAGAFIGSKMILLSKLDKSVCNLEDTKNNIYIKIVSTGNDYNNSTTELFIKDDVEKYDIVRNDDKAKRMIQITYPNERKLFVDANGEKICTVFENEQASVRTTDMNSAQTTKRVIIDFAGAYTLSERFILALTTKIKSVEMDGKECYELIGMRNPNFIYYENTVSISAYVEKDTGLPVKLVETLEEDGKEIQYITSYDVKFDCVTDEDIAEPDATEYKVQDL